VRKLRSTFVVVFLHSSFCVLRSDFLFLQDRWNGHIETHVFLTSDPWRIAPGLMSLP
jgi:hypothetical protein